MHADKQFKGCIELLGTLLLFAKEDEIPPKIMCSARIDQPPSKKSRSSVHPCQGLNPSSTATTRRRPNHSSWGLSFSRFCFSLFQTELNTSVSTLSFQRLSSRSSTRNNSSSFSSFCRILFLFFGSCPAGSRRTFSGPAR